MAHRCYLASPLIETMSIMTDYSEVITVQQLSDLVAFLEECAGTE